MEFSELASYDELVTCNELLFLVTAAYRLFCVCVKLLMHFVWWKCMWPASRCMFCNEFHRSSWASEH